MGGTTTDIALVKNDVPVMVTDGVSIGKWKTFVDGLYVKTFGLGGDSAIHYNEKKLFLEEYRAVPLCVVAARYPRVLENLKKLAENPNKHHLYLHEHYLLIKDLPQGSRYTEEEKALCRVLKQGPMILQDAAAAVDRDIYNLKTSRLIKEGYVQICSLTPTDIMHIKGDFTGFSSEASALGAQIVAYNTGIPVTELCHQVYDEIKRKLYVTIVKVLLENKDKHFMKNGVTGDAEKLLNEAYTMAAGNCRRDGISLTFSTDCTLVGIGAPIHIFLPDVAALLKTKAVIPEHHEVANALGAVMGNVYAAYTAEIKPNYAPEGIIGYMVFGGDEMRIFETMDEAESFAVLKVKDGARLEAIKRGARGEISVSWALNRHEAEARDGTIHLGTTASAHALGSFGL
jgi:N-methylhydantoinase A/oxoprolinase/acetone carboxylase beta subunit